MIIILLRISSFLVIQTGCSSGPILICISYDVSPCKDVPFGGCVDTASNLGDHNISQKFQFWGYNAKPNVQNILKLHIITRNSAIAEGLYDALVSMEKKSAVDET